MLKLFNKQILIKFSHCFSQTFAKAIESSSLSHRQVSEACFSNLLLSDGRKMNLIGLALPKFSKSLRKLKIDTCDITDQQLCMMLSKLPVIEELSVVNCLIKRENADVVSLNMSKLRKMDFSDSLYHPSNSIKDSLLQTLFNHAAQHSPLESFSASGLVLAAFPLSHQLARKNLKHLQLDNCGPSILRVADTIETLFRLKSLDLLNCFIMDDVLLVISQTLPQIESLKLSLNGVSMKGFSAL